MILKWLRRVIPGIVVTNDCIYFQWNRPYAFMILVRISFNLLEATNT